MDWDSYLEMFSMLGSGAGIEVIERQGFDVSACEDWAGGATPLRGAGGPLKISRAAWGHPLTRAMIQGEDWAELWKTI